MLPGITPSLIAGVSPGYRIERSLRFNTTESTYLSRTPQNPGDRRTWTFSAWVKRSNITPANNAAIFGIYVDASNYTILQYRAGDDFDFQAGVGGVITRATTTHLFRDPSAWHHVVVMCDTRAAVAAADRYQIWVNGSRCAVTASVNPAADLSGFINSANPHSIGRWQAATYHASLYLAEVNFIDGQALDASFFGKTDPVTGAWGPKAYAGLYGGTGFYLKFDDISAATATALGKDSSATSNLFKFSDNFGVWTKASATLTAGQSDPLGGTRAYKYAVATTGTQPQVYDNYSVTVGQVLTTTVYAKAGTANSIFQINQFTPNGGVAYFDLTLGQCNAQEYGTSSNTSASMTDAGGGWWKCSVTTTVGATDPAAVVVFYIAGTSMTVGDHLYIFRASLTAGSTIPRELLYTNGSAVPDKNWTPFNFQVTSSGTLASQNDGLVDTPTDYGIDTGLGGEVRGNYCTLNPLDTSNATHAIAQNGNLNLAGPNASAWGTSRGTMWVNSGKWYFECMPTLVNVLHAGVMGPSYNVANSTANLYVGLPADGYSYNTAALKYNNAVSAAYGATLAINDIVGVALDLSAGTLTFYKNGVSQGVAFTGLSGWFAPACSSWNNGVAVPNFGQRPFAYAAPAGHKAFCTTNLPKPTIVKPAQYFDVNLRTGTMAPFSVNTAEGFGPDFVWIKNRTGTAYDHSLWDTARGGEKEILLPSTAVEGVAVGGVAFDSDGFSSSNGNMARINAAGVPHVDWMWKKGAVPGLDIDIQTKTNATNQTFTHNLGVAPKMMLTRSRSAVSATVVWHHIIGAATSVLSLNTTNAAGVNAGWFVQSPTASEYYLGTSWPGSNVVTWLFAEVEGFSKFGGYTGSANANGPFIWCGFRPRWIMIRNWNAVNSWIIFDSERDLRNPVALYLIPNTTGVEANVAQLDFLSNGFKLRNTSSPSNAATSYLYAAFAESPFKHAKAR